MVDFEQYLGIKWTATGECIEDGFNCWTLVKFLFEKHKNSTLPDANFIATDLKSGISSLQHYLKKEQANYLKITRPKAFDIVYMSRNTQPCHVGLMTDSNNIIHSIQGSGVLITNINRLNDLGLNITGIYKWKM